MHRIFLLVIGLAVLPAAATTARATSVIVGSNVKPAQILVGQVIVRTAAQPRPLYSSAQITTGAFLASVIGLGVGHLAQDRYGEAGWVFSVSELATLATFAMGFDLMTCVNYLPISAASGAAIAPAQAALFSTHACGGSETTVGTVMVIASAITYVGLRIWEVIDSVAVPIGRNRHAAREQLRLGISPIASATGNSLAGASVDLFVRW